MVMSMQHEQQLASAVLADRFLRRNPEVNVSHGFKAGLVAVVAAVVVSLTPADAQAQSFAETAVGANLGSAFEGIKQVGTGLFGAAKEMVVGSGLADAGRGAASMGAKVVDGGASLAQRALPADDEYAPLEKLTIPQFDALGEALAQQAISGVKRGKPQFGNKEWKVKERTKDGLTKVANAQGDAMWLSAAGKPSDPRPGVAAIQHANGGFEHFQNGKLTAPAGSTLAARFGADGFEFHIKDGELVQAAPVVEAKVKPVGPAYAMR